MDFRGSAKRKTLAFFGVSLAFSKKARIGGSGLDPLHQGCPNSGVCWSSPKTRCEPPGLPQDPLRARTARSVSLRLRNPGLGNRKTRGFNLWVSGVVSPKTVGVRGSVRRECLRALGIPLHIPGTLSGDFWTLRSPGPEGPSRHSCRTLPRTPRFRGQSRKHSQTSGPKGPQEKPRIVCASDVVEGPRIFLKFVRLSLFLTVHGIFDYHLQQNNCLHDFCWVKSFPFESGNNCLMVSSVELIRGQVMQCNFPMFQGVLCPQVVFTWPNLTQINLFSPKQYHWEQKSYPPD